MLNHRLIGWTAAQNYWSKTLPAAQASVDGLERW
jgi:hypothetical protein